MKNIKNIASNLLGLSVPLVVSLVTIPIYISKVGEFRYGVVLILWLLVGYLGFLDLGMGRSISSRLASLNNDTKESPKFVKAAMIFAIAFGLAGSLLVFNLIGSKFFTTWLDNPEFTREVFEARVLISALMPIATISSVLIGCLVATESFAKINIVNIIGSLSFQILPLLVCAIFTVSILSITYGVLLSRIIPLFAFTYINRRLLIESVYVSPKFSTYRDLAGNGFWVSVSAIISPLMTALDRFAISKVLGFDSVALYAIPFQLAERSATLGVAVSNVTFPKMASHKENKEAIISITNRILILMVLLLFPPALIIAPKFFSLWISVEFSTEVSLTSQILLFGFAINILTFPAFNFLQANGRSKAAALIHAAELIPYLIALYILLDNFGIAGAAVAFSARVFVDFVLMWVMLRSAVRSMIESLVAITFLFAILVLSKSFQSGFVYLLVILMTVIALLLALKLFGRQILDFLRAKD